MGTCPRYAPGVLGARPCPSAATPPGSLGGPLHVPRILGAEPCGSMAPRHGHCSCPGCSGLSPVPRWHRGVSSPCAHPRRPLHVAVAHGTRRGVSAGVRAEHPRPSGHSCHLGDSAAPRGAGPTGGHVPGKPGAHAGLMEPSGTLGGVRSVRRPPEPDSCLISQARAGGGWKLSRGCEGWDSRALPAPHRRAAAPRRSGPRPPAAPMGPDPRRRAGAP